MENLLELVKKNLVIETDDEDELIQSYIYAAVNYAEGYQHLVPGYYAAHPLPPATLQAIVFLASYFYESRDGSTAVFFNDNISAARQVWNTVHLLLRLGRDWKV
ncbi:MAG: phage gp6-like head-tail connector protein [Lachnospiraceae bacterium]|nr:phage gp6-like head-tail connector protein [Lachnospiraceae bacterium]